MRTIRNRALTMMLAGAALVAALAGGGRPAHAAPLYTSTLAGYIYSVDTNGNLWCDRRDDYIDGEGDIGRIVGNGWGGFKTVFSTSGAIYGILPDGRLLWYRHDGYTTCADDNTAGAWVGPQVVGWGWQNFKSVFGMTSSLAPGGVIFAIDTSGNLLLYRHNGYATGTVDWDGPVTVGWGWGNFKTVFAGRDGVIFAIDSAGNMWWYRLTNWATVGNFICTGPYPLSCGRQGPIWEGPRLIGASWQALTQVFGGQDGIIYAVDTSGNVLWYQYPGYMSGNGGPSTWIGPRKTIVPWPMRTGIVSWPSSTSRMMFLLSWAPGVV